LYFNKEDERALLKLLSKVKQASAPGTADTAHSVAASAAEEARLRGILGKYNVSKEVGGGFRSDAWWAPWAERQGARRLVRAAG
jgi:hypothetical protein